MTIFGYWSRVSAGDACGPHGRFTRSRFGCRCKMVRNYKKKTAQGEWSSETMNEAVNKVLTKELSLRRAAELYNVPFTSLQRRATLSRGVLKRRGGQQAIDENSEKLLADRLVQLASRGFGITPKSVRKYAFEFAESRNISHRFNREAKMAGEDWFHRFMERNERLSIRKPEGLSRARVNGMKKEKVSEYFTVLGKVIDENNLRGKPECIYNVDETGVPLNNRPPNVVTEKGSKDVVSVTSVERGENVTVLACMNAAGQFIPPFVLFKGVRKRDDFMIGMPSGTEVTMTEKGWVTEEAFKLWVQHFNRYRSKGKVILILDGHASHTTLSVVELCESLEIELVLMPPHTSHALQPLDVSFFKPLKSYYNQHATAWQHAHPNKGITKVAFGGIFKQSWNQAASVGNATKGFEKTGIYPYNPDAIPDYKFIGDQISESLVNTTQVNNALQPTSSRQPDVHVISESSAKTTRVDDAVQPTSSRQLDIDVSINLPSAFHPIEPPENTTTQQVNEAFPSTSAQQLDANVIDQSSPPPLNQKKPPNTRNIQQIENQKTSLQQLDVNLIKQILPSPLKSNDVPKKTRNIIKPALHLTSPQSKANLLIKETRKRENIEKKKEKIEKQAAQVQKQPPRSLESRRQTRKNTEVKKQTQRNTKVKKNKATPKLKVKCNTSSRDWHCIYCFEKFVHPPVEDWIQCYACEEWCHEKCADREGDKGLYKCDLCANT